MADVLSMVAGQFADDRFRKRRRAWVKRIWWAIPVVTVIEMVVMTVLGVLLAPGQLLLFVGAGLGVSLTLAVFVLDAPPHRIERWRQGAEGEKATAKQLRRLERSGWFALHDIDVGRGNIDHLVVGPAGVFLLETKNLSGILSVARGVLTNRTPEEPDDSYQDHRQATRVRSLSAEVAHGLRTEGLTVSVQPVVVLWARFDQVSWLSGRVAWIRGGDLARVLADRPACLDAAAVSTIAAALRRR